MMAEKAVYLEQKLPEYMDNPLIEALPDILSTEEAMRLLTRRARYDETERRIASKYRVHCLLRLAHEYYQPLPQHFRIESKISVCIRQGYLNRNPLDRGFVLMANEGHDAAVQKRTVRKVPGYRPNASGFTIIGVSGVGKSTAVESVLDLYPQVIEHSEYKGKPFPFTQLVWLKLDCPHDGTLGGLCYSFFRAIDMIMGTSFYDEYKKSRVTIDSMMVQMTRIAHEYAIGVLVIDEIQHLSQAKSGSDAMLNFFVTLVNTIGVPVILIGTSKATPILQGEFRQARRGSAMGDIIWNRMEEDADWEFFVRTMWGYQWTGEKVEFSREMLKAFYHETQGIAVLAVILYALVQEEAILGEKETFDVRDIHETAVKRMALVQPMLEAIRKDDRKMIERYADITTIVLEQFDKEHGYEQPVETKGKKSSERALGKLLEEILPFLLKLGILPEKAEGYVGEAYKQAGTEDAKQIMARVYEMYIRDMPSENSKVQVPQESGGKDEDDLRSGSEPGSDSYDDESW